MIVDCGRRKPTHAQEEHENSTLKGLCRDLNQNHTKKTANESNADGNKRKISANQADRCTCFFAAMAGLGYRSNHCTSVQPMFLRKKIKKSFTPNTFLKFLFNTNSEEIAQFYSIRV